MSVYTTFTQVCFECVPPRSINFINGERVPSDCEHDLPVLVIDLHDCQRRCAGDHGPGPDS